MRRGKRLRKVNILPSYTAIKWQNWDVNPVTKPEFFNFQNRFIPTLFSPGLVTNRHNKSSALFSLIPEAVVESFPSIHSSLHSYYQ